MDYSSPAYHPYAEVYRRPLAKPFPQGVALGTTGVPTRSAAARLRDIEHDFPGKFERRAEINRLKSKRRLEANDYGLLPHNSWSTYLKPSTPARHYYSPQYTLDSPSNSPIVISRYPVRPLRMVQLAPLSVRCLPMPEQNAAALTLEMEADDERFQAQQDARRIQSAVWQSEATDRAIRLCKDRNRIRNQLRRIENARLVGPIYSRLGAAEQLGTRQKVLINYHKGAKSDPAPKPEARVEESHETPTDLPSKKHEEVVREPEVQQADESQSSRQSTFSAEEQPEPPPAEPEKQTVPSHEEEREKEVEKEKEKKLKKEHKYETAKEKRRREQQEKKAVEQKEEKPAEPESPQIQKSLEPLSLKIKEQTNELATVEPASPGATETFVLPKPKVKKPIEPESPKIKEEIKEITAPASPAVKEDIFEPMSPAPIEKPEPTTPVIQPESPKISEETKPLTLNIKRQTSELIESVPESPKIERQTPLQSPSVRDQPKLEAVPVPEPEPEIPEKEPEVTHVYEPKDDESTVHDEQPRLKSQTSVEDQKPKYESQKSVEDQPKYESQKSVEDQQPKYESQKSVEDQHSKYESQKSVEDQKPQYESQKSVEDQQPKYESQKSVEDQQPKYESQKSVEDQPLRYESQKSVEEQPSRYESQKSVEEQPSRYESQKSVEEQPSRYESQKSVEEQPSRYESQKSVEEQPSRYESQKSVEEHASRYESQKSVEEVAESLTSDEPHQEHADVERQTSITSEPPVQEGEVEEEPQSPTVLRRLVSTVSTKDGDACDPSEWDAEDAVEVELPSERKGIILSASDNAIPDRADHPEAEEDAETAAVEEPSSEEGTDTVVWAKGNNVESFRSSMERADELSYLSASTNEQAEAGSALTGDYAEETLSANGRPLSVDAESLVADDEQILDEVLDTAYSMHDRNLEPKVEEPDEETYKYDENVEYRSKSISIEEDE